jgi:hypothetical protein
MFESEARLREDILGLLAAIRATADARYVCVVERSGVRFELAEPEDATWPSRQFLEQRLPTLFKIPEALATEGPSDDVFADWQSPAGAEDQFLLAFVNGKVGLVVVCPDAEASRAELRKPLEVLADRLLRLNASWRIDERGHGFFFGRARLDLVVIGGSGG